MADDHSKEWKRADAEFAKTQNSSKPVAPDELIASTANMNTAHLKAARLARDAAVDKEERQRATVSPKRSPR